MRCLHWYYDLSQRQRVKNYPFSVKLFSDDKIPLHMADMASGITQNERAAGKKTPNGSEATSNFSVYVPIVDVTDLPLL